MADGLDIVTLDTVEEMLRLLGLNTDTAGTATLFARLAQIAANTDQVEAFVDTLETVLGTNGDTADPNGTVQSKLRDIRNYLNSVGNVKRPGIYTTSYTMTAGTIGATVLNVTGRGRLRQIVVNVGAVGGDNSLPPYVRVTLDGRVISDRGCGTSAATYIAPVLNFSSQYGSALAYDANFVSSAKVEIYPTGTGSPQSTIDIAYELE